jgi:hypothetical protein
MMPDIHWMLNFGTTIGILVLAVPAWSLNGRRKRLQALRDLDRAATSDDTFRARARQILIERHRRNVDDWRRIDEICLLAGYLLLLGSSGLRLAFTAGS